LRKIRKSSFCHSAAQRRNLLFGPERYLSAKLQDVNPRPTILALTSALLVANGCTRPGFPAYPAGAREFAYVANSAGNTVTVLDLVYLRTDRTLAVGNTPTALAVNPRRDEVYVVNGQPTQSSGSISVIDTTRNAVVATIPVQRNPTAISVDPTGQRAFISNTGSNTVSVIDLDARRQIATAPTGDKPTAILVSPDGRTLVVANSGSGSVSLYDVGIPPLSNKTTPFTKIAYGPAIALRAIVPACPGAAAAVILPDSSKTFVACSVANQVMSIWLAAAPNSPYAKQDASLTADHLLALLDVGRNPTNLTLKPDGGEIFVSNRDSDSISEIATEYNDVGSTFAIGNRPANGIVSADNGVLWISNSGADSLSLYSIDDGKFVSSIRTGMAPDALVFAANEQMLLTADTASGDVAVIRTASRFGPALFTILPAGGSPAAIAVKSMPSKP